MKSSSNRKVLVEQSRWALYATAGAATLVGGASAAESEIFYSGRIDLKFHPPHSQISSTFIQLDQPGDSINPFLWELNSEAVFALAEFKVLGVAGASLVGTVNTSYGAGPFNFLSRLRPRVYLSAQPFVPHSRFRYDLLEYGVQRKSKWREQGTGFVGFKFNDGTGWHYGWARIRKGPEPANHFELIDYAYGDVNEPIRTGQRRSREQMPAEASLGLLALGAAGLVAWRRSRRRDD